MLDRPREIKASHIARKGIVYIRQSSDGSNLHRAAAAADR